MAAARHSTTLQINIRNAAASAAIAVALGFSSTTRQPAPADVLSAGLASIGGASALRDVHAVRIQYSRTTFGLGQEEWPGAEAQVASVLDGAEIRDYERPGVWTRFRNMKAQPTFTRVFLADSAAFFIDTLPGGFFGGAPRNGYRLVFRNDPLYVLREVAIAKPGDLRSLGRESVDGRAADGVAVRLADDSVRVWFDAVTRFPIAIDRLDDDPVAGKRRTRMELSAWTRIGSLRLPASVVARSNDRLAEAYSITPVDLNPPTSDSIFASVKKQAASPAPAVWKFVELAPGVVRVEATSGGVPYNVLAASLGDSLIVFDPPIDDAYARAVLDTLRGHFPNARIRTFVVSHHHADHVGGVREAFANGMSGIASAEIAEYVRGLGLEPGHKVPSRRHVTAVHDSLAVGIGSSRFVLYEIPTSHARGMMMPYFPEQRLLGEVDLSFGPPTERKDLYEFITTRGLAVDRMARMHGPVLEWAAFLKQNPTLTKGP